MLRGTFSFTVATCGHGEKKKNLHNSPDRHRDIKTCTSKSFKRWRLTGANAPKLPKSAFFQRTSHLFARCSIYIPKCPMNRRLEFESRQYYLYTAIFVLFVILYLSAIKVIRMKFFRLFAVCKSRSHNSLTVNYNRRVGSSI
jgi:hypothetical protein